ncbi:polysaccharide deacetylase family protein [Meiothermus granaticius]|uniref:Peptidoglycan-N-acetylglucosamine deacetylase n=1 Tax=Meiothermus granaticius NBRC 107808 TaxID=1227551 RepID=A0A399F679_9DEIN|nr:polysaccharide deacetylase family protein [Meiothermus granaticius]RIH92267.1 Peptidoglycan-N-acetylglucosamine deacetylase [Meiothermus granaticius NBRC 107808]GEM86477.1 lipoprotein [Meiothermus granaticius NBRC 107808]
MLRHIVLTLGMLGSALAAGVITHGPRTAARIALTFDADMTPGMRENLRSGRVKAYNDPRIYAILEREGVKATFFLSGMWIEEYPTQTKALAQNPLFELANHSYSHPGFAQPCYGLPSVPLTPLWGEEKTRLDLEQAKTQQVLQTQALLERVAGVKNRYFRFPGGCASPADIALVERLGLEVIGWDAAGEDGGQKDPAVIVGHVLSRVHNGSIIVLHCHGGPKLPATSAALAQLIPALRARGFTFVKLSELLSGNP